MALLTFPRPRLFAATTLAATLLVCPLPVSGQASVEDEIKATFVFKFIPYVDWPEGAFSDPSDPFKVCVVASDSFVAILSNVLDGETARGRPVDLVPNPRVPLDGCHLLYVASGQGDVGQRALESARGRPILAVADGQRMFSQGAVIAFEVERDRVRFDISIAAAQRGGLTISSRLLRVARRVRDQEARR